MTLRRFCDAGVLAAAAAVAAAVCLVAGAPTASASAVVQTITVGSEPLGVSSDGTHVWVANSGSGTVSELDASTGAVVQTITVGSEPVGVSSDGTHVWVTNAASSGTVTELDASTGAVVQTITVGSFPEAVSSDGTHVWVANSGGNTVTELDASTGAVVQTITVDAESFGVSSDGTHVWVANSGGNTVTELDASTGAVVQTITVGIDPDGISSDGTHVWVANSGGNTVTELDASTGAVVQTIDVGGDPAGISSDGTHAWVATAFSTVTELDASTGAVVQTITVGIDPDGISSDGTHAWVANAGSSGTVSEILEEDSQAITFTGPGTGTVGGSATLAATGGPSGNPVVFTVDATSGTGVCDVSGTNGATVSYTGAGSCVIDANQTAGGGYAAAPQVQQTITVSPGAQAITFTGPATGTVGGSATLAATGGPSGNPVVFTVDATSGTGVCDVTGTNGATVSYTGAGSCVIDANQTAGGGYAAAPQVQQTITVSPGAQAITFTGPATGTVGGSATLAATGGPSGNPVVFTVDATSGTGVCDVTGTNGATVSYTGAGSCVIDANQTAGGGYAAAPQVQQTITVYQAPAFVLDSPPLTAVAGQPYDYTFEASGTPAPTYALASGAPSWLSVNASTGEVTGTPPAGTTTFGYKVTATNVAGTVTAGPFTVTAAKASSNADISAVLSCPAGMTVGGTGTCTLTVANAGPATASKVVAGILLPAALSEVSCTSGCARHANAFTWTLASLASGASAKFAITVKASAKGNVLVLAAAASQNPDPHPLNNISIRLITITR